MPLLLTLPAIVSLLALAAHFVRENSPLLTFACLGVCALLFVRKNWVARLAQITLAFGALTWLYTTRGIIQMRILEQRDWHRAALIMVGVATFSLLAAALFQTKTLKAFYAPALPEKEPVSA